jgi:hypothetical protein
MYFLKRKDFEQQIERLIRVEPWNSQRRDRYSCCYVKTIDRNGFELIYFTDKLTSRIQNICNEYEITCMWALKLARAECWKYAWKISSPAWRHKAILKRLARAKKLYDKES